ncbi:unnamed protein product [Arctogadus glacialis]
MNETSERGTVDLNTAVLLRKQLLMGRSGSPLQRWQAGMDGWCLTLLCIRSLDKQGGKCCPKRQLVCVVAQWILRSAQGEGLRLQAVASDINTSSVDPGLT